MLTRFTLRAVFAALALTAATGSAFALDIRGMWQSSEGTLILRQAGGQNYEGMYDQDSGRITGSFDGHTLQGFWMEDSSQVRCSSPMNGTYYWGQVELGFGDGIFAGRWDYCGQGGGRGWTGNR
jgi:hypothetical protein